MADLHEYRIGLNRIENGWIVGFPDGDVMYYETVEKAAQDIKEYFIEQGDLLQDGPTAPTKEGREDA